MTTVTVTTTGGGSFVIPAGVTSIIFEAWGGGGTPTASTGTEGGGGGGAYVRSSITVSPGDTIYYSVGATGQMSWFRRNTNSSTNAWQAGPGEAGGAGGTVTNGADGTLIFSKSGGAGAAAQGGGGSRRGSGGGGSAGPLSDGSNAFSGAGGSAGSGNTTGGNGGGGVHDPSTGGTGTVYGGAGGAGGSPGGAGTANVIGGGGGGGGNSGANGGAGGAPGGGGGGGGNSGGNAGAGARGQIRYTYVANQFFTQRAFRFYEDGPEDTSTAIAAQDTNISRAETAPFQLRFGVQETAGVSSPYAGDWTLYYRLNGGSWTPVSASSSVVQAYPSASLTDNAFLSATPRLTGGTGSFNQGKVDENNGAITGASMSGSARNELLWSLQLVPADVEVDDVIEFRVFKTGGTALEAYTVTPSLTVAAGVEYLYKGAGNRASHYKGAAANDTARYLGNKTGIYPS